MTPNEKRPGMPGKREECIRMKRLTACLLALMLCAALIPAALAGTYTTGPITYTVWDGWTEQKSSDELVYYYHNTSV